MDIKLKIENLYKSFDNHLVINDVSFNVKKGELLSILGPSGGGKTTLLRILIGLINADSGKIYLEGNDITNYHPKDRKMGIVFQNYALFNNMTVYQNIAYALKIKKNNKCDEIVNNIMNIMGIMDIKDKYPNYLSGGQKQRVAIARTLVLKPEIILFDEPLAALDVDIRLIMRKEITEINKKMNTTMIYITHDQEEAFDIADRILVLNKGKIEQIDTPINIIKSPKTDFIKNFVIRNLKLKSESLQKFIEIYEK